MTALFFLLIAVIPSAMIVYGWRTRKRETAPGSRRVSFMSRRTVRSAEAWEYAHRLFSNLMLVEGINVLVCSEAFYGAVLMIKKENYPVCVAVLMAAQVVGVAAGYLFSGFMVRRVYDIDGALIDPYAEDDADGEGAAREAENVSGAARSTGESESAYGLCSKSELEAESYTDERD